MVDINLSTLNGRNGFIISGLDEKGLLGDAVSSAGDINGDGKADIIIGAKDTDIEGKNDSGKVYVIFGSDDEFDADFNLASLDGSNGFSIDGLNSSDFLGNSVSNAGDINNDGFEDIIIGAVGNNNNAGASYVIFGGENFNETVNLSDLNGNNGFTISGLNSGDLLGESVSSAGDINGDEIPDFIVSASEADTNSNTDTGVSYVIFGRNGGFDADLNLAALDGSNGFVINGINTDDSIGISVSGAGNINNDEIDDLIIGAPFAGQVYILFGSKENFTPSVNLSSLNGINGFAINGIESGNGTGFSVADAGDVNNDGFADIIIGASLADVEGRENAGQAYVIFGKETGFDPILELSELDGTNGFTINGAAIDDLLGTSVSGAGDVNGDRISDIIVGASALSSDTNPGTGYVIFGRENNNEFPAVLEVGDLTVAEGFVISSDDNTGINLGEAVSGAGDVNGDGIDDIIVGAPESDPNGNDNAGESYVIFGRVTYPGDIDNDGAYTSADAYGISRLAAGLDTEFSAYPGIDPVLVGDVNRDGVVSAFDARIVANVVNGIESEFLSPIPT